MCFCRWTFGSARAVSYTHLCEDFAITLGQDEYLVLGDNRPESYDSRAADVGVLSRKDFVGRARVKLWPFEQFFRGIY